MLYLWLVSLALCACSAREDPRYVELAPADLAPSAGVVCEGEGSASERCAWQSSDWSGDDWLPYPAQATLVLPHELGRTPSLVWVYISFVPDGGSAALASGDLGRIVEVTDSTVTVQNATNGEYYCRVVVQ